MYNIQIIPQDKLETIFPFFRLLDEKLTDEVLSERLKGMKAHNYECVGVYDESKLIGISGLWILDKYYVGKHIEPDNVIIHPDYRGQGIGEQLMQWIYDYAKEQGCVASELNCYVSNHRGVAFWVKEGFRIIGYHMRKDL